MREYRCYLYAVGADGFGAEVVEVVVVEAKTVHSRVELYVDREVLGVVALKFLYELA